MLVYGVSTFVLHQVIGISDFNNTAVSTSDFVYVVESTDFNDNAVVTSVDVAC